jgi:hypothetical protein
MKKQKKKKKKSELNREKKEESAHPCDIMCFCVSCKRTCFHVLSVQNRHTYSFDCEQW